MGSEKSGKSVGNSRIPGFLSVLGHVLAPGPGDFPGGSGIFALQLPLLLVPLLGRILGTDPTQFQVGMESQGIPEGMGSTGNFRG